MDAKELRLGNYIEWSGNIHKVIAIDLQGVFIKKKNLQLRFIKTIKPIPLTEEWLLKFGFTKHKNRTTKEWEYFKALPFDLVYITIDLNNESKIIVDGKEFSGTPYVAFGHYGEGYKIHNSTKVHQLQNLYFALTGEELIIK